MKEAARLRRKNELLTRALMLSKKKFQQQQSAYGELEKTLQNVEAQKMWLAYENNLFIRSKSWAVTAPLRKIVALWQSLKQQMVRIPRVGRSVIRLTKKVTVLSVNNNHTIDIQVQEIFKRVQERVDQKFKTKDSCGV